MLVYIATPYRSDDKELFEKQLQYTKTLARKQVVMGHDVIVPHLYYPRFLDDSNIDERSLGMASARSLMLRCDLVLVGIKYGKSEGVLAEIEYAERYNLLVKETI